MTREQFQHEFARSTTPEGDQFILIRPVKPADGPRHYGWLLVETENKKPARWICLAVGYIPKDPVQRSAGNNYFIDDEEGYWVSDQSLAEVIRSVADDTLYDVMYHNGPLK